VTLDSVLTACDRVSGASLSRVTYFGLESTGHAWDHGSYHEATMGVELATHDRGAVFVGWGDAWGHFGLEVRIADGLQAVGDHHERRDFSAHPWWAPFAGSTLAASLMWREGHVEDDGSAPVALVLISGQHAVWIASAVPIEDRASPMGRGGFLLGMDEVIVTGDRGFAETIGLFADSAAPREATYWRSKDPGA
jgi:hypothetical protein